MVTSHLRYYTKGYFEENLGSEQAPFWIPSYLDEDLDILWSSASMGVSPAYSSSASTGTDMVEDT